MGMLNLGDVLILRYDEIYMYKRSIFLKKVEKISTLLSKAVLIT